MAAEPKPICCLCWIDGIRSEPVKGWDGVPICRAHLATTISNNAPAVPPAIKPSPGLSCTTTLH